MLAALASLLLAAEPDVAEEGKNIITVMLVTGLVFVGVIVLGQLFRWLGHRRKHRRAAARRAY
jgi:heme/copper-type cytochrome/quinol oxidase subunit 2